jgi:peroxiredoxin/Flp pilus assembly protein TadD
MREGKRSFSALFLTLLLVCVSAVSARAQSEDWRAELDRADRYYALKQFDDAIRAYKRANSLANNSCVECLWGLARAFHQLGANKNAVEMCERVVELAAKDAPRVAEALNLKGVALTVLSEGKDEKKLQEAEAALRRALELRPEAHNARFNLGQAVLMQKRDAEGVEILLEYLKRAPTGNRAEEARLLVENPRRAREPFAPDFSLTTLGGEYLSLPDLYGKVVMLDFWFTTCPPCVESIPALKRLAKRFEKENFVLLSISVDSDDGEWRAFLKKHKMAWPQHRDTSRKVVRAFEVTGYPTYILLDHEGIIRYRSLGYSSYKDGQVEEAVRKWLKARPDVLPERKPFAKAPPPPPVTAPMESSERPGIQLSRLTAPDMSGFGPADPNAPSAEPAPVLEVKSTERYEWQGRAMARIYLSIRNWPALPKDLFEPSPDLPPCGLNTNSARTWLAVRSTEGRQLAGLCALRGTHALENIVIPLPPEHLGRTSIFITMHDRRTNSTYRSNVVPLPSPAAN